MFYFNFVKCRRPVDNSVDKASAAPLQCVGSGCRGPQSKTGPVSSTKQINELQAEKRTPKVPLPAASRVISLSASL
jgi:hypothetical protein